MKQMSFASLAFANKKKTTRREQFLAEMEQVVPWARLHQRAQPRPRHDLLHLSQELLAPRGLLLVRKGQRCKRHLFHSIPPFATVCFNLAVKYANARINSELP